MAVYALEKRIAVTRRLVADYRRATDNSLVLKCVWATSEGRRLFDPGNNWHSP